MREPRSWLFVPADSEKKIAKALESDADAVIFDLEDSVAPSEKVRARGLKAGVMVEIPSAALLAHRMLEVVDFLSIGTNDLTQYAMAADRMATDLAHLTDPWQPAVLQLIAITAHATTIGIPTAATNRATPPRGSGERPEPEAATTAPAPAAASARSSAAKKPPRIAESAARLIPRSR